MKNKQMTIDNRTFTIEVSVTGNVAIDNHNSSLILVFNIEDRTKSGGFLIQGMDINIVSHTIDLTAIDKLVIQETVYQEIHNRLFQLEQIIIGDMKSNLGGIRELHNSQYLYELDYNTLELVKDNLMKLNPDEASLIEYTVRVMQTKYLLNIKL